MVAPISGATPILDVSKTPAFCQWRRTFAKELLTSRRCRIRQGCKRDPMMSTKAFQNSCGSVDVAELSFPIPNVVVENARHVGLTHAVVDPETA